jgi:gliding motility-associated-like protein
MRPSTYLGLFWACVFFPIGIFAQNSITCPGVPGACGYTTNQNTNRSSGSSDVQDGSGTLGNTYNNSACGLNFVVASERLGQRFSPIGVPQPAPFNISGMPSCAIIEKAFLWAEGSGSGAPQTATILPPTGPSQSFPMTLIGTGPDKCWGYAGSATYRADVTSVINGNGIYTISGLLTNPPNSGEDMDGATLLIIYRDPTQTYQGTMIIDDGAIVINGGIGTHNMTYPAVCGPTQNAQAFICVGDIQFTVNSLDMNGTPTAFAWNWWNYVSTPTTVAAAQTSSSFVLNSSGDCFNLCVAGLYYQTTTCTTCVAASNNVNLTTTSTPPSTCSACDATATVSVSPAGSYTYSWQPSGQTDSTAINLCPGVYIVNIAGLCVAASDTIIIPNPSGLSSTISQTAVSCFGAQDGTATVIPSGGQGPYTYNWQPSGGTGQTETNLLAGTYNCTVTDANGCIFIQSITVTEPPGFSVLINSTGISCNGDSNGVAIAVPNGGSPGYTYSWLPGGQTTDTIINVPAGTYTVNVIDSNGCGGTSTITITQPPPMVSVMTTLAAGCNGSGSATVTVTGGSGVYTYLWSSSGTSATELNLTAGQYYVTITDANGCFLIDTATIINANAPLVTGTQTNITCNGANDGTATVTVTPATGTAPFTYSWTPFGGNNATATGLGPGLYTCTVLDSAGCSVTYSFFIVDPPPITSNVSSTSITCNGGADGSATVSALGGSPPFTFSWSPSGGNSQTANGLSAGTYIVTITDTSGCVQTQTVVITQPSALIASTQGDSVCVGVPSLVSANASGGTGPYTYSWSNGGQGSSITVITSQNITLTVTVTDANGCTTTQTAVVNVLPQPVASFTNNSVNGQFVLNGGTGQLCFTNTSANATQSNWIFTNGTSTINSPCINVTLADTGDFCAILIAQNGFGCPDSAEVCVDILNVSYSIPNVFTPNADGNNEYWTITNEGMSRVHCQIYDRWGILVYEWDSPTGYWDGVTLNGKMAVDGVYYFTAYMTDYGNKVYDESGFLHLIRGGN